MQNEFATCVRCFHQNLSFKPSIFNRINKCILRCDLTMIIPSHICWNSNGIKKSYILDRIRSIRDQYIFWRILKFLAVNRGLNLKYVWDGGPRIAQKYGNKEDKRERDFTHYKGKIIFKILSSICTYILKLRVFNYIFLFHWIWFYPAVNLFLAKIWAWGNTVLFL